MDDLSRSRRLAEVSSSHYLSGIVPEFAALMQRVCEEAHENGYGTDWKNEHPEVQKYVRKIVAITNSRNTTRLFDAFEECERITDHEADGSLLEFPCPETGAVFQFDRENELVDEWWPGDDGYEEMIAVFRQYGWSSSPQPSLRVVWPDDESTAT